MPARVPGEAIGKLADSNPPARTRTKMWIMHSRQVNRVQLLFLYAPIGFRRHMYVVCSFSFGSNFQS